MIIFRADGNKTLGTGHIMRCLSIADAFAERGEEAVFVTADDFMRGVIEQRGYECHVLGTDYREMESELPAVFDFERFGKARLMIVDSYFVTEEYFKRVGEHIKTAYIDDLEGEVFPADYLINYNIFAAAGRYRRKYEKVRVKAPFFILGPGYAPLRKDFKSPGNHKLDAKISDVLVTTGGADSLHIGYALAGYLVGEGTGLSMQSGETREKFKGVRFHFVVGAMSDDYEKMRLLQEKYGSVLEIHRNVADMRSLMAGCDIAVSAAGSTLYELCACGVPTITFVLADNQKKIEKGFLERGVMRSLGDYRGSDNFLERACTEICSLESDFTGRREMSEKAQKLVDGLGAERIAELLTGKS